MHVKFQVMPTPYIMVGADISNPSLFSPWMSSTTTAHTSGSVKATYTHTHRHTDTHTHTHTHAHKVRIRRG